MFKWSMLKSIEVINIWIVHDSSIIRTKRKIACISNRERGMLRWLYFICLYSLHRRGLAALRIYTFELNTSMHQKVSRWSPMASISLRPISWTIFIDQLMYARATSTATASSWYQSVRDWCFVYSLIYRRSRNFHLRVWMQTYLYTCNPNIGLSLFIRKPCVI